MTSPNTNMIADPMRLDGTPDAPVITDVRTDKEFAKDYRALPGGAIRNLRSVASWTKRTGAAVLGMLRPTTP